MNMENFRIWVSFRRNSFTEHNSIGEVKGVVEITTYRCNVEGILANLNVQSYQIIGCQRDGTEDECQLMDSPKKMPDFYYN